MTPKSPHQYPSTNPERYRNANPITTPRTQGRVTDIISAFFIITIPMVAFSGLLLGLIYSHRVEIKSSTISNLSPSTTQVLDNSAILVDMSSTTLTLIASWSSTVAPLLLGFVLTLASYPIARRMLIASHENTIGDLPTPFQFAIMLRMIHNASLSSLLQWSKYYFGWRERRQP